jgi:hypothetical protein
MTNDTLAAIGTAFGNISAAIAERIRQEGQGATAPFDHFVECISSETIRLAAEEQTALAAAVAQLRNV